MSTAITQPLANKETAVKLGLLPEEYDRIVEVLGREPNFTELSIYSVMWSEHCSYKNSIKWLKTLPREGEHLLAAAGEENAGLVDLGDGLACAFKIESHNHPSAIEPYQGAATGVGGIHRDIFTMGARPVAALNSLRFGDLKSKKTQHLIKGVVKGIGDYGNCFGVPTVGGEVYFESCYAHNPLVNAMSVGIVNHGMTISAVSRGVGNPVYIVGSATGKDGIHGATFASEDISEDSTEKLPAVQVGDPFQEKLLLEATLELARTGAVVGMQDMGAAGITCSTAEMSARGKHGMRVYLDRVPTRQKNMQPFEILLSESQERMLVVVQKGREKEVEEIFNKWDLHCAIIGEVTPGDILEYYFHGEKVAVVPASSLVLGGGAPVYDRVYKEPAAYRKRLEFKITDVPEPRDPVAIAEQIISHPNIASKRWIYQQYDSMVGINTLTTNAPADAAVIRLKEELGTGKDTRSALAMTVDCNSRYVYCDPYKGAVIAVSEAARNIVCSGARPLAVTNCLNFGNPYNPEVYWHFVQAVKGMGDACRKFNTPVTGGNVSFYNQSHEGGAVFPTPTIGMIGKLEDVSHLMTLNFKRPGDYIYLIGKSRNDINASQYLVTVHGIQESPAPYVDLEEEYRLQLLLLDLIHQGILQSAHDVSDGGLFVTLIESSLPGGFGFKIQSPTGVRMDAFLFGEAQGRVVVSVASSQQERFQEVLSKHKYPYSLLGQVNRDAIEIDNRDFGSIHHWQTLYDNAIESLIS